jgi:hypothetical protein
MLLMNFPAIMQYVLLVDFQVKEGDPFAQLLQKLRTRQSMELHGCCIINMVSLQPPGERCDPSQVELQLLHAVYQAVVIPSVTPGELLQLVILLILLVEHGKSLGFYVCFLNFVFNWQVYL